MSRAPSGERDVYRERMSSLVIVRGVCFSLFHRDSYVVHFECFGNVRFVREVREMWTW